MKKGKIASSGFIVILFVVTFLYIGTSLTNGKKAEESTGLEIDVETEMKQKEVEEISIQLYQKDGFFEQVSKKLEGKGYEFQTLVAIYSRDDIQVKYVLANKEVTESVQEEVKSIFYESVENYDLDTNSFNLKIGDSNDGPDW